MRSRWTPAVVAAVVTCAFALWNPPLRDLAAHTFRAEYFEQHGFAIWNNTWYGGHYLPAYSVLFPPLAHYLTPQVVGALSAVAAAALFEPRAPAPLGPENRSHCAPSFESLPIRSVSAAISSRCEPGASP